MVGVETMGILARMVVLEEVLGLTLGIEIGAITIVKDSHGRLCHEGQNEKG